jgi:hypothetical protein
VSEVHRLINFVFQGFMWMYDHWDERKVNKSWKYRLLFAFNVFQIVGGTFIMVAGVSSLSRAFQDKQLIPRDFRLGEVSSKSETPTSSTAARRPSDAPTTATLSRTSKGIAFYPLEGIESTSISIAASRSRWQERIIGSSILIAYISTGIQHLA